MLFDGQVTDSFLEKCLSFPTLSISMTEVVNHHMYTRIITQHSLAALQGYILLSLNRREYAALIRIVYLKTQNTYVGLHRYISL